MLQIRDVKVLKAKSAVKEVNGKNKPTEQTTKKPKPNQSKPNQTKKQVRIE